MAEVSRARPVGAFATRLAVAVLLAACLGSGLVALLAGRLATAAVHRETAERVHAAASAISAQLSRPPGVPDRFGSPPASGTGTDGSPTAPTPRSSTDAALTGSLATYLAALTAEPDVLGVLVVDERGTVLANLSGSTDDNARPPEASATTRAALVDAARTGRTTATTGRRDPGPAALTVRVPLHLPGRSAALQVELEAGPAAERAAQVRRALGVALMLGAGSTGALVFLTGGWGLVRRHRRALHAVASDDLTGLGSRRAFRRELQVHVEQAVRYGLPLTLALIDVNGLETVKATIGRRQGEVLLLGVGSVLRRATGPVGRPVPAYRIGGEAFALIMPGTGQDDAFPLTDTLRRHIGLDAAPLTANIGLGVLDPLRCPDPETLLIAADAALFEARSLGGNRVVGAGDGGTGLRWVATSGAHDRLAS
jgi:diguanylate cyclase (GGDEF)-like protein